MKNYMIYVITAYGYVDTSRPWYGPFTKSEAEAFAINLKETDLHEHEYACVKKLKAVQ